MAATPSVEEEEPEEQVEEDEGSEADAEGEVEEDSEADAEGEDDDEDAGEVVGAVKTRSLRRNSRKQTADDEDESDAEVDEGGSDGSESDESEEEKDWEAADEEAVEEEIDIKSAGGNRCTFCLQDEEHDPGEEFEEWLACAVCGDNAHRQCARENSALASDEDAAHWRCPDCVSNGLQEDFRHVSETASSHRRSSAPRMARDLLPAARGGIKPDSHSVFNTLILDEDPMDGSRSLRKRKTPSDDADDMPRSGIRKRRKTDADDEEDELANPGEEAATVNGLDGAEEPESPRSRTGRPQRHLKNRRKGVRIVSRSDEPKSCIMAFAVTTAQWDEIERAVQKKQRRRERDRIRRARNARARTGTVEIEEPQHFPAVQTSMYSNPFYAFPDRETDENKGKPYGGILTDGEAETAKTYPSEADRKAFADARDKAEQKWKEKIANQNGNTPARTKQSGLPSKIRCVNFGKYEIDTWHAAPYPEEYSKNKNLYLCEFCLKYMSSDYIAWRHKLKCSAKYPPGDEIYRNTITNPETQAVTTLSFWEVDGRRNPLYCQNLCLLAKLFLGSKTLYYDVEPFLFYIMTENDEFGCHFVGYFSKEKRGCGPPPAMNPPQDETQDSQANGVADQETQENGGDPALSNPGNNVSCILVLPVHMRRGFGRVLIEFSYLLTKVEGRTGSPEKPLSDMGLVSYRSYWRTVLCRLLLRYQKLGQGGQISVAQIAKETGMTPDDIISTLEALRFLVRDPITKTYALRLDYDYMKEYVDKHDKKATIQLDPERLVWTPYVMGKPTNLFAMGEEATINQPMQTVAPRTEAIELPDQPEEGVQQAMKEGNEALATATEQGPADHIAESTEDAQGNNHAPKSPKKSSPEALSLEKAPSKTREVAEMSPRLSPRRKTPNGISIPARSPSPVHSHSYSNSYDSNNSQPSSAGPIPPTRFEIFPPIPGMQSASKRRPGRSGRGSRKHYGSPYRTSPVRRSTARRSTRDSARGAGAQKTASALRRTRSRLGEVAVSADDTKAEEQDDENADENEAAAEEDDQGDADADADADADGEVDDDGDAAMADAVEDDEADAPGEDDDEIQYE